MRECCPMKQYYYCHNSQLSVDKIQTNNVILNGELNLQSIKLNRIIFRMETEIFCNKRDLFCFICGKFTSLKNKRGRTDLFASLYSAYYEMEWIEENYVPKVGCSACFSSLSRWSKKIREKPKYKVPVTWCNPGQHNEQECYFCVNVFASKLTSIKKDTIEYIGTQHTMLPIAHNTDSPPLNHLDEMEHMSIDMEMDIDMDEELDVATNPEQPSTSSYVPSEQVNLAPRLISQTQLNNMCRRLELSQRKSRMLAVMLKENSLLSPDVKISSQINRQSAFIPHFTTENDLSFCPDIKSLFDEMDMEYVVEEWRLFIDASRSGLKAVLLHNDNAYMPVPVAYSRVLKETHDSMKLIFTKIKYDDHKWDVSGDLKVVALIMGFQLGRTRNACFICTWISTEKNINHYRAEWEKRSTYEIGVMNVRRETLVPPERILLPTLHIKLGLISCFIRKLNKEENAFRYLEVLFPRLSLAKRKQGKNKSLIGFIIFIFQ